MDVIKILSLLFLAIYLIVVGLSGLGVTLGFVHPAVLGFFALASGILFLIRAFKCCCCHHCDIKYPNDKDKI